MNIEILEDEIISIDEYEEIETIDIEIDSEDNLFFANDILTHNSGINNTNPSLTDVSESTALLHTVDVLFGIITEPLMKSNGEYYLVCLADRVAGYENMKKRFTVDFKHSRIEEDMTTDIQDMEFFINSMHNNNKPRGQQRGTQSQITAVLGSNPDPDKISSVSVTGQGLF